MTLEKAIEILNGLRNVELQKLNTYTPDAIKLGIEALKDRKKRKNREAFPDAWLLPGETKE